MNATQELIKALQTIPWYQQFSEKHFDKLAGISKLVEIDAGSYLFREGDHEDFLYVLLEGRLAIEIYGPTQGKISIYTAEPMDVVGWSSVTPVVRQRTAGARAVFNSRLVATDAAALRQLCEEDYELGYHVMRRMANVVAGRLMVTRLQLLNLITHPNQRESNE